MVGLELGADDYVVSVQPSGAPRQDPRGSSAGRGSEPPATGRTTGDLHIDEARHAVTVGGRPWS